MKQKFPMFSFVHVDKNMPPCKSHFLRDFDAVVAGTFSQIYGGTNIRDYAVYQIKNGKIVNQISWYSEDQLILLPDQNTSKAAEMIEEYNFKG